MIPGLYGIAGLTAGGPIIRYFGTYSSITDSSGGSYTFSNVSLGPESPDRLIVFSAGIAAENSGALGSATLGGTSTTLVANTYFQNTDRGSGSMYSQVKPTGASANIVVSHTGSPTYSIVVDVFSIIGLKSSTVYSTGVANGTANTLSTTINTQLGGVIIASGGGWGTSTPYTWVGATKVSELNSGDGGAQLSSATLDNTANQTGRTISWSTPSSGSRRVILAASWA